MHYDVHVSVMRPTVPYVGYYTRTTIRRAYTVCIHIEEIFSGTVGIAWCCTYIYNALLASFMCNFYTHVVILGYSYTPQNLYTTERYMYTFRRGRAQNKCCIVVLMAARNYVFKHFTHCTR